MNTEQIHECKDDFDQVFSGYGFLFTRNLKGINKISDTYIQIVELFNTAATNLNKNNLASATHIFTTLITTYDIFKDFDTSKIKHDITQARIDIARIILLSSAKDCPFLISMADADSVEPPTEHRAEYHLETRQQPTLTGAYSQIILKDINLENIPIPSEFIFEKWNIKNFIKKSGRIPTIGFADTVLSANCPTRVFNIPIRLAGKKTISIPKEFTHLESFIEKLSNHAFSITELYKKQHPNFVDRFYYYLSVDQRIVNTGEKHRGPHPHSDDLQGPRYVLGKLTAGWEYLVADVEPTTLYDQSFDLSHLNENTNDVWAAIEGQADETKTYQLEPYEIGMMTFYDIHRGTPMKNTGMRTFIKMVVSEKIFDALGDTTNPAFVGEEIDGITYPWRYTSRKVQKFVNIDRYKN